MGQEGRERKGGRRERKRNPQAVLLLPVQSPLLRNLVALQAPSLPYIHKISGQAEGP